jgi:acyl-coenzyme A synthetase/AMP-(fatty) acid ligase
MAAAHDALPGSIPELLAIRRAHADGEFLVTDDERLGFAEADARSQVLADALLASGVGKGTRVGILFPNCAQWIISWLAAARIGALTVPLSTFAPGAELARLLRHTDIQMVLRGTTSSTGSPMPCPVCPTVTRRSPCPKSPTCAACTSGPTATGPGPRRGPVSRDRLCP